MGLATSLSAIGDAIDPSLAYWSARISMKLSRTNKKIEKVVSERDLLPTLKSGQKGVRKLDWGNDIVSTGDIHHIRELTLHCPDGRTAVLEITPNMPAFQFKTKSLNMLGASDIGLECQVIGRVIDKQSGRCECFIWDYRPKAGAPNLVAYKSSIYCFGSWRDTLTPIGALGLEVQGFRL
jgi:hypothetical protein